MTEALKGAEITVQKVLDDLEAQRHEAKKDRNHASAIRCSELQGKYLKMFTDRIEQVGVPLEDMSVDELRGQLRELVKRANVDLVELLRDDGPNDGLVSGRPGSRAKN